MCYAQGKESKMDNRSIGVFDSGLGGLTMVKALAALIKNENIIYLGDTGRVPYGSRSKETITKYAAQNAAFLAGFDIKAMVVACNTVCSVAFEPLREAYEMPIYEVVTAPCEAAVKITKNKKIGVIGTAATISSGTYEAKLRQLDPGIDVCSIPCPLFVPLAEEGFTAQDDEIAICTAKRYLTILKDYGIDTLILGCTHYPLLTDVISYVVGGEVTLVDSGAQTAKTVAKDLEKKGLLSGGARGKISYFVTDATDGFESRASRFLKADIHGMARQVSLE